MRFPDFISIASLVVLGRSTNSANLSVLIHSAVLANFVVLACSTKVSQFMVKCHMVLGALPQVKLSIALLHSSRQRFNGIKCCGDNNVLFWSRALSSIPHIYLSAQLLACQLRQARGFCRTHLLPQARRSMLERTC